MVDVLAISGALTSLKTANDLLGALIGAKEAESVRGEVVKCLGQVIAAQRDCLAAQEAHSALLKQKDELERKVVELEDWGREKARYELQDAGLGQLAYTLKEAMQGGEPRHHLCPNCYASGRKSILQPFDGYLSRYLNCHACKLELTVGCASCLLGRARLFDFCFALARP